MRRGLPALLPALLLALAWAASTTPGRAADPAPLFVDVRLEPTVITVGDRVRAELTLILDGDLAAAPPEELAQDWPEWTESWGEAAILEVGPVRRIETPGTRTIYRQELVLTAFRPGEIVLPPERVALGEAFLTTATAVFEVRSVLAEGENAPRPPTPPVELPSGPAFGWLAAILLFVALYYLSRLDFGAAQIAAPAPRPTLSPFAEFERRLRLLDASRCEPTHTGISRGLRVYLGRRLELPLLESTTRELAERLRGVLPDASMARLITLATDCDQVKYARREEPPAVTAERVEWALKLGREIDAMLRPRESEPDLPQGERHG